MYRTGLDDFPDPNPVRRSQASDVRLANEQSAAPPAQNMVPTAAFAEPQITVVNVEDPPQEMTVQDRAHLWDEDDILGRSPYSDAEELSSSAPEDPTRELTAEEQADLLFLLDENDIEGRSPYSDAKEFFSSAPETPA
jgi:hypothetical protein